MKILLVSIATIFASSLSHAYTLRCHGQVEDLKIQFQSQAETSIDSFDFEVQATGFDPMHDSGSLQTRSKQMNDNTLMLAGVGQLQVDSFTFELMLSPLYPKDSLLVIHFEDGESLEFPLQCRSQQVDFNEPKLASAVQRAFPIGLPVGNVTAFRF